LGVRTDAHIAVPSKIAILLFLYVVIKIECRVYHIDIPLSSFFYTDIVNGRLQLDAS